MRLPVLPVLFVAISDGLIACGGGAPPPKPTDTPHQLPIPVHSAVPVPTSTPVVTGTPAAVSPANYLMTWPLPPDCPTRASDAAVCAVRIPGSGTTEQASADEYILFREGWIDPTEQSCDEYASNTTATLTLDGRPVAMVTVPCQLVVPPSTNGCSNNQWRFDMRYLSSPLSPGRYTAIATITYHHAVSGSSACTAENPPSQTIAAGTVQTFRKTVTVP